MNTNNTELKKIYKEYAEAFDKASENSRAAYIARLAPGSKPPPTGKLYGDDAKNEFSAKCNSLATRAADIINSELEKINKDLNKAPTAEAVNTCTLLIMRKSKDPAEYSRLLNVYRDNPQTCDTIRSIAEENGIVALPYNSTTERAAALDALKRQLYFSMTPKQAENGNATPDQVEKFFTNVDQLIPEK